MRSPGDAHCVAYSGVESLGSLGIPVLHCYCILLCYILVVIHNYM